MGREACQKYRAQIEELQAVERELRETESSLRRDLVEMKKLIPLTPEQERAALLERALQFRLKQEAEEAARLDDGSVSRQHVALDLWPQTL